MKILIILIITFFSFAVNSFPIPKDKKASFDIIRKNKTIGSVKTTFEKINQNLIVTTIVDINVKLFFIPAYKHFFKCSSTISRPKVFFAPTEQ